MSHSSGRSSGDASTLATAGVYGPPGLAGADGTHQLLADAGDAVPGKRLAEGAGDELRRLADDLVALRGEAGVGDEQVAPGPGRPFEHPVEARPGRLGGDAGTRGERPRRAAPSRGPADRRRRAAPAPPARAAPVPRGRARPGARRRAACRGRAAPCAPPRAARPRARAAPLRPAPPPPRPAPPRPLSGTRPRPAPPPRARRARRGTRRGSRRSRRRGSGSRPPVAAAPRSRAAPRPRPRPGARARRRSGAAAPRHGPYPAELGL